MKALSITIALALTMITATSHAKCMRNITGTKVMLSNQVGVLNAANANIPKLKLKSSSLSTEVDSTN